MTPKNVLLRAPFLVVAQRPHPLPPRGAFFSSLSRKPRAPFFVSPIDSWAHGFGEGVYVTSSPRNILHDLIAVRRYPRLTRQESSPRRSPHEPGSTSKDERRLSAPSPRSAVRQKTFRVGGEPRVCGRVPSCATTILVQVVANVPLTLRLVAYRSEDKFTLACRTCRLLVLNAISCTRRAAASQKLKRSRAAARAFAAFVFGAVQIIQ